MFGYYPASKDLLLQLNFDGDKKSFVDSREILLKQPKYGWDNKKNFFDWIATKHFVVQIKQFSQCTRRKILCIENEFKRVNLVSFVRIIIVLFNLWLFHD